MPALSRDRKRGNPDHAPWSSYMDRLYYSSERPSITTYDANKLAEKAREATKENPAAFTYAFGSAGLSPTEMANRCALNSWRIVPRMLRDASERNLNTTIFGVEYRSPVLVAPVGVQGILHADGELATARAAHALGIPFIMSTASTRTIEQVAEANGDGKRWYQLFWPTSTDTTLSLLARAKKAEFTTLVVTLDAMTLGWRPLDSNTSYLPSLADVDAAAGTSDPVPMGSLGMDEEHRVQAVLPSDQGKLHQAPEQGYGDAILRAACLSSGRLKQTNSGLFGSWSNVKFVRDNWDGPLVLKGVQSVADAHAAIDVGADGIVVSNHGGRQVDSIPSFVALEQITADERVSRVQKAGDFTVLFDSGIRTGTDIIKALAMGAQGVLIARPFIYALAISGQQGVEEVFRGLLADTEITLGLSGYRSIDEIQGRREEIMTKWESSAKL